MLLFVKKWFKDRFRKWVDLPSLEGKVQNINQNVETLKKSNESNGQLFDTIKNFAKEIAENKKKAAQIEHDVLMPKYIFHSPLGYTVETYAPIYEKPILVDGELLPLPPPVCRAGYSPDDDKFYLEWGRLDHNNIVNIIEKHYRLDNGLEILDFGCSSGRVLRHFYKELKDRKWKLYGVDIQAYLIEWMRQNFSPEINVIVGTTIPHLPFRDSSLDVIYGISVFTHAKFLWDMWLTEFKRVLKKGGLCIQTVQCETAWKYYHNNRDLDWVKAGHPNSMLQKPEIDCDFFFYGDAFISQIFYREEVVKRY